MLQPAQLTSERKLMWSAGRGVDVWALFQACAAGDLEAVRALVADDPSLVRAHYDYRKPLYFAIRENRLDVVRFLLGTIPTRSTTGWTIARWRSREIANTPRWSGC